MIRFVDIRGCSTGHRFAFYDTVTDKFVEISGEQTWGQWFDLAEVAPQEFLDRIAALCPLWIYTEPKDCEL